MRIDRETFLKEVKTRLDAVFGERLVGVVLYGSEARGDSTPDSDIDLLVLLAEMDDHGTALKAIIAALYDLEAEVGFRHIHGIPVLARDYRAAEYPLYRFARDEGIPA